MKQLSLLALVFVCATTMAQNVKHVFKDDGLKFNEGLVAYKNAILVSNFGGEELDPLNTSGKGFIMSLVDNELKMLIPADGTLSAPKGMAVYANYLFIADVNKVVVYNLKKLTQPARIIKLPEGETYVNDVAVIGDIILVSVTNTGNIYGMDASDVENIGKPLVMGRVPGANGLVVSNGCIYCASYNPDGQAGAQNVIYYADVVGGNGAVSIKPLIAGLAPGQYDGLALTEDGQTLYFSSWSGQNGGEIFSYSLSGETPVRHIDFGVNFGGPADICIKNDMIYIPDLPNSILYRFEL